MKQKVVVILLGLVIVLGISVSLYMSFGSKDEPADDPVATETPIEEGSGDKGDTEESPTKDPENPQKPETVEVPENPTTIDDLYEKPVETVKEDITETDASVLEQKVRSAFRKFDFQAGLDLLSPVVKTTKNEGEGAILHQLNLEGTLLLTLLPARGEEDVHEMPDLTGIGNMLRAIEDPENKLIGTIMLNDRVRVEFIVDQASLNPIFEGSVHVSGQQDVTGKPLEEIRYVYSDVEKLVRVDFTIEEINLFGYIIYFPDGTSKLFGIYSEGETKYKTVSEWKKFYEAIYE